MAYTSRNIVDRIASGDDKFFATTLGDGRVQLTPAPDSVTHVGTAINKELLQLMEDRIVWLMNRINSDISTNPFSITFGNLDGVTVIGVWNEAESRIEC